MQEIKKRRILLASVLKPADEPRMFYRMAKSLASAGFEVFIAGFPSSSDKASQGVTFLPHVRFSRFSFSRITVRIRILRKALSVRPNVFIVCTHELLGTALLFKLFTGKKIMYDVQENYYLNILHTKAFPKMARPIIAVLVRMKEIFLTPFLAGILLAEKCYWQELPFTRHKAVIIENKCKVPFAFSRKLKTDVIQLIFTGTIAESTGIFEVISLVKKLNAADPQIVLKIIGQCFQERTLKRVEAEISGCNFITLNGGKEFVSHEKILEAISASHFGVIHYPASRHTENRVPSKLYEYLACQLPIIMEDSKTLTELCPPRSSVIVDFKNFDANEIVRQIKGGQFYFAAEQARWVSEERKLVDTINSIVE